MINLVLAFFRQSHSHQKWSREHKARGQGHKKIPRQRPKTGMLEAKDQGHWRKCSPKKKVIKIFFRRSLRKRSSQILCKVFGVFQRNFYDSKNSAVLGREQGNFRRFVGFEAKAKDFKMCLRGLHLWYSQQAWSKKPLLLLLMFRWSWRPTSSSRSALSILSSATAYLLPESLWNVWSLASSLSNNPTLNFQWVRGHAGLPGNVNADLLAKAGASLPNDAIPCPLPTVIAKIRDFQYHNWRRHISHSYLNYQVPKVSSEELLLSRPIPCELSLLCCHGHSLLLS